MILGNKDFELCMATPEEFVTPPGMVLLVLGNLYGLFSSGRNFSKAMNIIVLKLGYKNTPYDPKFFCKWIDGLPILAYSSDDFCWCGPSYMLLKNRSIKSKTVRMSHSLISMSHVTKTAITTLTRKEQ